MAIQLQQAAFSAGNPSKGYFSSYNHTNLPNTNTALTISCWLQLTSNLGAPTQSIVGMYNGSNNASTVPTTGIQIGTGQSGNNGQIDCWTWGGIVLVSTNGTGYTAPLNTWIHVTYSCTAISGGAQKHSIYINGVLQNTSTNALQVAGVLSQFYINGFPQSDVDAATYTETSLSQVDDCRIFNRQLSSDEVLTMYTTLGARSGVVNGLLAAYKFNEKPIGNTVTDATDYTGNGFPLKFILDGTGQTLPTYIQALSNLDTRAPQQ